LDCVNLAKDGQVAGCCEYGNELRIPQMREISRPSGKLVVS